MNPKLSQCLLNPKESHYQSQISNHSYSSFHFLFHYPYSLPHRKPGRSQASSSARGAGIDEGVRAGVRATSIRLWDTVVVQVFSRITYVVMQTCTVPAASATRTRKQIILFLQDCRLYRAVVVSLGGGGGGNGMIGPERVIACWCVCARLRWLFSLASLEPLSNS